MNATVRLARPDDAAAIAAIYAPIVRDTFISFEEHAPDAAEMRDRIESHAGVLPFFVCTRDEGVAGYAYAGRHRERAGYRWSVDVSIYVAALARRAGVAQALYEVLLEVLERQGYYNAFAGITLPNEASVALHRGFGFEEIARYRNVGYKAGSWHDTLWLQRPLRAAVGLPAEPIPLRDVRL